MSEEVVVVLRFHVCFSSVVLQNDSSFTFCSRMHGMRFTSYMLSRLTRPLRRSRCQGRYAFYELCVAENDGVYVVENETPFTSCTSPGRYALASNTLSKMTCR